MDRVLDVPTIDLDRMATTSVDELIATVEMPITVIEPREGWQVVDLGELWRHRELLFFLTWRDVKVRYKQTALGAAWVILQPLTTMIIFSLFFGRVAASSLPDQPYPLFVLSGLIPWMFFANAIASAGQSIVGNERLVTKIYFPRLLIPFSAISAGLIDMLIAMTLLLIPILFYRNVPGLGLLLLPIVLLGLFIAALGVGTMLAALTVAYRDFRYIVPFLVQLWMFATPVIYLQVDEAINPRWQPFLHLNPAQGLIDNFRRALLGGPIDPYGLAASGAAALALLAAGLLYFRRVEREFADII